MTREARKAVKVIRRPKIIKILADPVRREILRQLDIQPQNATQLAKKLHIAKATISYHIRTLRKSRLIKVKWAKPGSHGILEKYYEPTAALFIEDHSKISPEMEKYILHLHIERLRGMFSAFQLIDETWSQNIKITPDFDPVKELAQEVMKHVTNVAEKYEKTETMMTGEALLTKIYGETLKTITTKGIWRQIFPNISKIDTLISAARS